MTGTIGQAARRNRTGFTVTELVVAVGVLVVLVTGFSVVLSQSQQVVVSAQQSIRRNAAVAAISEVIRQDLRDATRMGFLRVDNNTLVLTTGGVASSVTQNARGIGGVIRYGRTGSGDVLYRQGWALSGSGGVSTGDRWFVDLADIQDGLYTVVQVPAGDLASLVPEPNSLAQVEAMWQLLAANCTGLTIEYAGAGSPLSWSGVSKTWTRTDPGAWPALIRLRVTLTDPTLPVAIQTQTHEVICAVGG